MFSLAAYLSFFIAFVLPFAIGFELPLVLIILARLGLVTGQSLRQKRRFFYSRCLHLCRRRIADDGYDYSDGHCRALDPPL